MGWTFGNAPFIHLETHHRRRMLRHRQAGPGISWRLFCQQVRHTRFNAMRRCVQSLLGSGAVRSLRHFGSAQPWSLVHTALLSMLMPLDLLRLRCVRFVTHFSTTCLSRSFYQGTISRPPSVLLLEHLRIKCAPHQFFLSQYSVLIREHLCLALENRRRGVRGSPQ